MIVEVIGGADEHPQARVVDVDNLGRLHLALGEVTDEEAAEVLERTGLGRFQDADTASSTSPRCARPPSRGRRARLGDAVGRDGRGERGARAGCPRTAPACRCPWRAPPGPDPALNRSSHPELRNEVCATVLAPWVIVVTPPTRQDVAVRMTTRHGIRS